MEPFAASQLISLALRHSTRTDFAQQRPHQLRSRSVGSRTTQEYQTAKKEFVVLMRLETLGAKTSRGHATQALPRIRFAREVAKRRKNVALMVINFAASRKAHNARWVFAPIWRPSGLAGERLPGTATSALAPNHPLTITRTSVSKTAFPVQILCEPSVRPINSRTVCVFSFS